jgi:mono/diheme cytochrome c family protein
MTAHNLVRSLLITLGGLSSLLAQTVPTVSKVVDTYCSGCHNGQTKSPGGNLLDKFDATQIALRPDIWARVYRQMQAGAMPPMGVPRPDRATYAAALASIEHALGTTPSAQASSQQIAARLATLLWRGEPDAALLQDAQSNRLTNPSVLERHVRRMLADDRAQAFVQNFFFPWLQLNQLSKADPDKKNFPDYDPSLRDALAKETELFLLSQLRDDRDPIALWSANYTYLNEQLAQHYGVAKITGSQFRRVNVSPARAGLLGQGSVLMVTSTHRQGAPAYTSPAARSTWIRNHFLGATPPMAFPGAQPVKPELPITPQTRTLPKDPCITCHQNFFPLGYALEHFDPLGRWRTHDQMGPVDASGVFVDGTPFNGIVELRSILLQYPEAFRTTITEKLVAYSAGGTVSPSKSTPDDLIRARRILSSMPKPRWSAIIAAVVLTTAE